MNIGIIIFIISVIVTGISALRDKSHESRQNQKPPSKIRKVIINPKRWFL